MTTYNTSLKRRLKLIKEEPIFRQQSGELQKLGNLWAALESDLTIKSSLRNIDLTVWDESENLLHNFAQDLEFAPYNVQAFLSQIADKGREVNLEIQLPSMVSAFTIVRICAGGKEVREKHNGLLRAIIDSQKLPAKRFDYFNEWCVFFENNKFVPGTNKETLYRRGDPLERAKDNLEASTENRTEALLGQILEATKGWNCKEAFGNYWNLWTELWVHLLKQEEMVEKVSKKHPGSLANSTSINITLVCNVAGLLKKHLKSQSHDVPSCTKLANLIKDKWGSSQCHKELDKTTEIEEKVNQIKGWLAINVK